jgi:hypothetical protein
MKMKLHFIACGIVLSIFYTQVTDTTAYCSTLTNPQMPTLNDEALTNTFEKSIKNVSKPKIFKRAANFYRGTQHIITN